MADADAGQITDLEARYDRSFVAAMRALLSGANPIVATIGAHGGGFIAEVKRGPECELWEVTHGNRDELPARILAWLAEANITIQADSH